MKTLHPTVKTCFQIRLSGLQIHLCLLSCCTHSPHHHVPDSQQSPSLALAAVVVQALASMAEMGHGRIHEDSSVCFKFCP